VQLLAPSLAAFDTLKADVLAFDPVAPLKQLLDALKATIDRVLAKLNVAQLLEPAGKLFDQLVATLRQVDPDDAVQPLVAALRTLAGDIQKGIEQLRDALKRLQAAIPSSDALSGALGGAAGDAAGAIAGAVDVDVSSPF
jgi:hypothetical protein